MAKNLPFDCSHTEVWVSPKNWKTLNSKKSLDLNWYVQCKFYDPLFKEKYPNGFQFRKRLNKFRTLEERKAAVEFYLEEIPLMLAKGFNPITKKYMIKEEPKIVDPTKLSPEMMYLDAMELAFQKLKTSDSNRKEIRIAKNRFIKGAKELRLTETKIKNLEIPEVKEILDHLNLTDNYYNKFLVLLGSIFTELIEYGCVKFNHFKMFRKRKLQYTEREVLSKEDFKGIKQYLKINHYDFYRYSMIFFLSGARTTELMNLQVKDVDLINQEYKVIIKKGQQFTETKKVILKDALPLWKEVISESKNENDYLFAKGLKPGKTPINADQITRRWRRIVKNNYSKESGIEITADFYSLKHLFLDSLDESIEDIENVSMLMASHTNPTITNKVYLVNKKQRQLDKLKDIRVSI
ncbi:MULTISPECIES: tyrosine-type recombinase/integrase [unclassified Myroides]|uniref:tyrosine-type recombinase/integrase n=1 Tax=unclassified Myroides TaxID=2642485 RepID=UPI003D2F56C4